MARVDLVNVLVVVIIAGSAGFLGLGVWSDLSGLTDSNPQALSAAPELEGTSWVEVGDQFGRGADPAVVNSRGNAYNFTGADDSYLVTKSDLELLNGENWSVMQGVWVNPSATGQNMTVLAVGDPTLVIEYLGNQSQAQWSAFLYSDTNSYRVNVDATDPTNATVLWVTRNATAFAIHRNNTTGESVDPTIDSTATGNLTVADNFNGVLDETRVNGDYVNATERGRVVNNPVAAGRPAWNRQTRIYYDRGGTIPVYYTGTTATGSNFSLVAGFPGQTMDRDTGVLSSGDYVWDGDGPRIRATSGGRLEYQPVAFVDYTYYPWDGGWDKVLKGTIDLFATVFAVIGGVVVVSYLLLLRGR